ncbi:MAG: zinc-ribbon domain-containing protein [Deltaproteobacteria bacterium]|nr:zinc-ribbon domain-containing protein [Deltaproteobacteria bacterium]
MNDEEKIVYLANLVLISSADGNLSPEEAKAIEECRIHIGAEKIDLQQALESVVQGKHNITPAGCYSEKVKNLEDMVYIAILDGVLSESEKPEILSFAKAIKMTQDQVTEIFSEAKQHVQVKKAGTQCTGCRKEIPPASKFCPYCGAKV